MKNARHGSRISKRRKHPSRRQHSLQTSRRGFGAEDGFAASRAWWSGGVPVKIQRSMWSCPQKSNNQPATAPVLISPTRCFDTDKLIPHSPPLGRMLCGWWVWWETRARAADETRDAYIIEVLKLCPYQDVQ